MIARIIVMKMALNITVAMMMVSVVVCSVSIKKPSRSLFLQTDSVRCIRFK